MSPLLLLIFRKTTKQEHSGVGNMQVTASPPPPKKNKGTHKLPPSQKTVLISVDGMGIHLPSIFVLKLLHFWKLKEWCFTSSM